jgi:hypothetical protein
MRVSYVYRMDRESIYHTNQPTKMDSTGCLGAVDMRDRMWDYSPC